MKELSIEQKAQAYDKALEIISDYYQKIEYSSLINASTDREVLEKAFPQLKEGEDERIRKELIRMVEEDWPGRGDVIAWLEKQGEQKPAWSEEDEKIALSIEQVMNCASLLNIVPEKGDKIRTWLKSLKERVQPQNTWKPSDEQMTALNYVINLMASSESALENDYYYNVFKDLREQLKKLRGE